MKQLIEAGTNLSPKEKYTEYTPLYYATQRYFKEIAELLIANGADVNAKCAHGVTVLDYLQNDNKKWFSDGKDMKEEIIKLLRKNGANLEAFKNAGN